VNKRKIEYWNTLRKRLNILVLVVGLLIVLTAIFFKEKLMMPSLLDIVGLFIAVNFPLLLLEMLDRAFDLKERGLLKKGFIYVMYSVIVFMPVFVFING